MSNDGDFFGGSLVPSGNPGFGAPPGRANPHLTANKEYGQFGGAPRPPAKSSTPALPIVIAVVVIALAAALGMFGYRMVFGGSHIELPDSVMGLQRVDSGSPEARQLEQSVDGLSPFADDMQVALYQSNGQVLFVMGGNEGTEDPTEVADFFTGFQTGLGQYAQSAQLSDVPPGPHGGQMKCLTAQNANTCAWVDEDTFGAFVFGPATGDVATTAVQVRESVEK